jgi:hypothetical protein
VRAPNKDVQEYANHIAVAIATKIFDELHLGSLQKKVFDQFLMRV